MGHPAAPGHDVERELLGLLVRVLAEVLEPLKARLRGALGGGDDGAPFRLVGRQRPGQAFPGVLVEAGRQGQRVLHGQLGPRPDREVRGMRGVAEQHDVAVAPAAAAQRAELQPPGIVGHQLVPAKQVREQLADPLDGRGVGLARRQLARRQPVEPGRAPDVVVHLDDERAARGVIGVAVHLHDAELGLLHEELEGVKYQVRAQPHVPAVAEVEFGTERGGAGTP